MLNYEIHKCYTDTIAVPRISCILFLLDQLNQSGDLKGIEVSSLVAFTLSCFTDLLLLCRMKRAVKCSHVQQHGVGDVSQSNCSLYNIHNVALAHTDSSSKGNLTVMGKIL